MRHSTGMRRRPTAATRDALKETGRESRQFVLGVVGGLVGTSFCLFRLLIGLYAGQMTPLAKGANRSFAFAESPALFAFRAIVCALLALVFGVMTRWALS